MSNSDLTYSEMQVFSKIVLDSEKQRVDISHKEGVDLVFEIFDWKTQAQNTS